MVSESWTSFLEKESEGSSEDGQTIGTHAQEICLLESPSPQSTLDLIPDWTSELPAELGVKSGYAKLFEDGRVTWALDRLGGAQGKTVVELGPLEGGHTYMLEQAGASDIIAIEANKLCYLKCLIAKELLNTKKSQFLLGDFSQWLDQNQRRFDIGWVAGVLYHMDDPTRLLRQMGAVSDQLYIYTHYIPDDGYSDDEPWTKTIERVEDRDCAGTIIPHYVKTYLAMGQTAKYCGGVYTTASWIKRSAILDTLRSLGYSKIETDLDNREHPNGPCFHLVASK